MHQKHSNVATLYVFLAAGSDYTFDGNGELVADIDGTLVLMYQRNLNFYMDRLVFVSYRNTGHIFLSVERSPDNPLNKRCVRLTSPIRKKKIITQCALCRRAYQLHRNIHCVYIAATCCQGTCSHIKTYTHDRSRLQIFLCHQPHIVGHPIDLLDGSSAERFQRREHQKRGTRGGEAILVPINRGVHTTFLCM